MKIRCAILILVSVFLGFVSAPADPVNFMVGSFTFVRPTEWVWKELPDKSHASALLMIPGENEDQQSQVLISFTRSTRDDVLAKWKSYFVEPPIVTQTITSKKIKQFPVTYEVVEGTYRVKKILKTDHVLVGMVVETKGGNVCGRLIGPRAMVEKWRDPFKRMIEEALKEE